jgi:hypothetical protein
MRFTIAIATLIAAAVAAPAPVPAAALDPAPAVGSACTCGTRESAPVRHLTLAEGLAFSWSNQCCASNSITNFRSAECGLQQMLFPTRWLIHYLSLPNIMHLAVYRFRVWIALVNRKG